MPHRTARRRLAIGIIGHRPNRLPVEARPRVEAEVGRVLDLLAEAASAQAGPGGCDFTLVSALAEGADQMAAKAALARGFHLVAPLPFAVSVYAKDFAGGAVRDAFHALVERADKVEELPGSRTDEGEAYEAVGRAVIAHADILVVVWDGGASAGRGGTTEMILEAARRGVPTVHVDAHARHETRLLVPRDTSALEADLTIENLDDRPLDGAVAWLADVVLRQPPRGAVL